MTLSFELWILGIVTIIYVCFFIGVGIKMALVYRRIKNKLFIYIGISVIGTAYPWCSVAVFFICAVFFNITPPLEVFFLLNGSFIAIPILIWLFAVLQILEVDPKKQKWILIFFTAFWGLFGIIYNIVLFTDTNLLGTPLNEIEMSYAPISQIHFLIATIELIVTVFLFGRTYWKSSDPRISFQGKIILLALFIYIFAAVIEIFIDAIPIRIVARCLVMGYGLGYYLGVVMPKWFEQRFFKENNP